MHLQTRNKIFKDTTCEITFNRTYTFTDPFLKKNIKKLDKNKK